MPVSVTRINSRINPDYKKVIPRFFNTGDVRARTLIERILHMQEDEASNLLHEVLNEFSLRYKNIKTIFTRHFELINYLITEEELIILSEEKKQIIGSYFTMEYSIEAAALFNPSIVEDPDQRGAGIGQKKVIISFRATGESHISSIVFKQALLDENAMIHLEPSGRFIREGVMTQQKKDSKSDFKNLLDRISLPENLGTAILNELKDQFSYKEIEHVLENALLTIEAPFEKKKIRFDILGRVNTNYELHFSTDSLISERVIFPVTRTEKNGIEDARFVRFIEDDGSATYIATYTAYDGSFILPQLIITTDFCHFKIAPLHGKAAINKNLALFPRKINGQYVMLSRIDNINNYIMFSDDIFVWEEATLLQQPKFPWEFVQIGNAGSPIETEKGWLVITHGVGPMRKYCLGASLFDLDNPTRELGRLKEPMLVPNEDERDGYVPNVVYSCGSIIHGNKLFIPYAVSDHASSFATVSLSELLDEILKSN
ncbi:glycoside hydrolase family 130 protein [Segetibacter sp.]|jgi:predicted GH43/DUF377 family glycosyl hydrolase|uniref:glycoside hydrolase family 130 protein n=1 Tax=Segetibacter sp. TaxID=2231182 RepID=UPI002626C406|nr:glycoside hydrolase family 130 protein [Segetibacter sp.]MCW3081615.1 glycosidase [Segetibacter sp.]